MSFINGKMNGGENDYGRLPSWQQWLDHTDPESDLSTLNEFIRDKINQTLSEHQILDTGKNEAESNEKQTGKDQESIPYTLIELIGCAIVQMTLPPNIDDKKIKLLIEHRELVVSIGTDISETILLPFKADVEACKAQYKEYILEIHLPQDFRKAQVAIPIIPI